MRKKESKGKGSVQHTNREIRATERKNNSLEALDGYKNTASSIDRR